MSTRIGLLLVAAAALPASLASPHGTVVYPVSRVYRVYQSNPENPSFQLAANAVAIDGSLSYYTWNEVSRNIDEAVQAGLPPGFDYSPWLPDGEMASAGRTDPNSAEYPRTYAGLDQVSPDWPTTSLQQGETIVVDFYAPVPHDPSVWDVWMTTPDWTPDEPLTWGKMEFLGRPDVTLNALHYTFPLTVPTDRAGHHVLWVAWQRDDPVGEVFISASDIFIETLGSNYCTAGASSVDPDGATISMSGSLSVASNDVTLRAWPVPSGQFGVFFHGPSQASQVFGQGVLCVGAPIVRAGAPVAGGGNELMSFDLDLTSPGASGIAGGVTRHLQAWYRDPVGGGAGFNLSDGLTVAFLP